MIIDVIHYESHADESETISGGERARTCSPAAPIASHRTALCGGGSACVGGGGGVRVGMVGGICDSCHLVRWHTSTCDDMPMTASA